LVRAGYGTGIALAIVTAGASSWRWYEPQLTAMHIQNRITDHQLADTLIQLERQSWVAWKGHDATFFNAFLSDDHVEVGFGGIIGKAAVVASVASPACLVVQYAVDSFAVTRLNAVTAVVTYHAAQSTTCNGRPVPSPVWVSSTYVLRDGRWLNAVYQQTQANR
jgi:hypothetical protein